MNADTIDRVRSSWAQVVPIGPQAARLFYENLFTADPGLRSLFRNDLDAQGAKLTAMLDTAVRGLGDLNSLVPVLQALARRHAGYGVRPEQYAVVGAALLNTLEQGLGETFSETDRTAWSEVYGLVADVMIAAQAGAAGSAGSRG